MAQTKLTVTPQEGAEFAAIAAISHHSISTLVDRFLKEPNQRSHVQIASEARQFFRERSDYVRSLIEEQKSLAVTMTMLRELQKSIRECQLSLLTNGISPKDEDACHTFSQVLGTIRRALRGTPVSVRTLTLSELSKEGGRTAI